LLSAPDRRLQFGDKWEEDVLITADRTMAGTGVPAVAAVDHVRADPLARRTPTNRLGLHGQNSRQFGIKSSRIASVMFFILLL
jgi:hypothetical protein